MSEIHAFNKAAMLYNEDNKSTDTAASKTPWNGSTKIVSEFTTKWNIFGSRSYSKIFVEDDIKSAFEDLPKVIDCALSVKDDETSLRTLLIEETCLNLCRPQREKFEIGISWFSDNRVPGAVDDYEFADIRLQYLGVDGLRRLYAADPEKLDQKYKEIFFDKKMRSPDYYYSYGGFARLRVLQHIEQAGLKSKETNEIVFSALYQKDSGGCDISCYNIAASAQKILINTLSGVKEDPLSVTDMKGLMKFCGKAATNKKDDTFIPRICNDIMLTFAENYHCIPYEGALKVFHEEAKKIDNFNAERSARYFREKVKNNRKEVRIQKYGNFLGRLQFLPV